MNVKLVTKIIHTCKFNSHFSGKPGLALEVSWLHPWFSVPIHLYPVHPPGKAKTLHTPHSNNLGCTLPTYINRYHNGFWSISFYGRDVLPVTHLSNSVKALKAKVTEITTFWKPNFKALTEVKTNLVLLIINIEYEAFETVYVIMMES